MERGHDRRRANYAFVLLGVRHPPPNSPSTLALSPRSPHIAGGLHRLYKQVLCRTCLQRFLACFTFIFAPPLLQSPSLSSPETNHPSRLLRRPLRLLFSTLQPYLLASPCSRLCIHMYARVYARVYLCGVISFFPFFLLSDGGWNL